MKMGKYSETRYALREGWKRRPKEEKMEEEEIKDRGKVIAEFNERPEFRVAKGIVGERNREPPGPASEALPEVLDLSHYGYTNIFTHFEMGWHFDKSVSYDAMYERRVEKKRLKAEIRQIFSNEDRFRLLVKSLKEGRSKKDRQKDKDRKERDRRMDTGKSYSDDEDNIGTDLTSRRRGEFSKLRRMHMRRQEEQHDEDLDLLDALNPPLPGFALLAISGSSFQVTQTLVIPKTVSPPPPPRRRIELPIGSIPLRPDIKGEKLYLPEDKSELILHWTDLIGFSSTTKFACFFMAGEMHVVLPQLMMELSMGYGHDWNRLKRIIEALNIRERIVTATNAQVEILVERKIVYALEVSRPNGTKFNITVKMMRKSDVSRLLGEYLPLEEDENDNIKISRINVQMDDESMMVEHGCQGYATGRMFSTGYIRCDECSKVFKPDAFICHSHFRTETVQMIHWGFDPRKWRNYINLSGVDRHNKEKIMRFNNIICEAVCVEIRSKTPSTRGKSQSVILNLNENYNRRAPSPFEVGAESIGRIPQKRRTDEEEEEEEEIVVQTEDIDDEIQIIEPPTKTKQFGKDDFLFKVPDLFATPLSRKYTQQALKTKGVDLEGLIPCKLPHQFTQDAISNLQQSLFLQHSASVYSASVSVAEENPFDPIRALLGLFPAKDKKVDDDFPSPFNKAKEFSPPLALKSIETPPTSTAVVPYQKEDHSVVPFSSVASAFLPVSQKITYWQDAEKIARREHMSDQLDSDLRGLLQLIPPSIATRICEVVMSRDELRDVEIINAREDVRKRDAKLDLVAAQLKTCTKESDEMYLQLKKNGVEVPNIRPATPPTPSTPKVFNPIPKKFSPYPITSSASLPSSSQPLALLPPPSSAPSTPSRPSPLNGGRSLSMSSPIGIRPVPASMLGQPGPSNVIVRPQMPIQQPQRVVGQRGRPRGSGGSAYQRKLSQQIGPQVVQQNNENMARIERQIQYEQQKQQMEQQKMQQLQHLRQLQMQQQQQQTYTVPQPSPMGLMNGGTSLNGSPTAPNLLSFGGLVPTSLSSLLASSQQLQQLQLQNQMQQLQPDFSAQLRLSEADAAAIMARAQLETSMSGSSGLSTPLPSVTPSNGLLTSTQDGPVYFDPQAIQQLLQQSTTLEQQQQHQLRQQQLLQSDQPSVVQQPPAASAAPSMMFNTIDNFDMLRTFMENPSLIPPGMTLDQIKSLQDSALASAQS